MHNDYFNELKADAAKVKELGRLPYSTENSPEYYRRAYRTTADNLREWLTKRAKNLKALQYWAVSDERLMSLLDGQHDTQVEIILGY